MNAEVTALINDASSFIWGKYFLIPLLAGVGVYLTVGLRAFTWRHLAQGFKLLWAGRRTDPTKRGEISPFQALMTALAATVGTGNIAGVATAIYFGGPGAIFWMWVIALFGMATKFTEAVLAVHFRTTDANGNTVGGPMYYIRNGLGDNWRWLAGTFAFFGMVAAFGIGNMVQANSVADVMHGHFAVSKWLSGLVIAVLTALVVIGGVKRIAAVAATIVPLMALLYVALSLIIVLIHFRDLPAVLNLIITEAFAPTAGAGAGIWVAMRWGFARGIFSNEAGLGSAAIAHAAAKTATSIEQGMVAMLGTFIDTLCLCTLTAVVILLSGAWQGSEQGAALSATAFTYGIGTLGAPMVGVALIFFAFTTIIGWSYYGERCAAYLCGVRIIAYYRVAWVLALLLGATLKLELVWALADVFNGLMALPNLIALVLLSPLVFRLTRAHLEGKVDRADAPEASA